MRPRVGHEAAPRATGGREPHDGVSVRAGQVLVATAVLLGALGPAGCGVLGPQGCTTAGCASVVSVDTSAVQAAYAGATLTLCVRDRCDSRKLVDGVMGAGVRLGPDNAGPDEGFSTDEPLPVHLTIERAGRVVLDERTTATLVEYQPNGDRCEPTCWIAAFDLTSDGLRAVDPVPER